MEEVVRVEQERRLQESRGGKANGKRGKAGQSETSIANKVLIVNVEQLARYDTRGFCETSKQMADGDGECMCLFFLL